MDAGEGDRIVRGDKGGSEMMKNNLNDLIDVLVDAVYFCFSAQSVPPTRKTIVEYIRKMHPDLCFPKLDLEVGLMLNWLVERKRLQRVGGLGVRRYVPGVDYGKREVLK